MKRYAMLVWLAVSLCAFASASAGEVAVIVNRSNPTETVSLQELVKIFKQEKQQWDHGMRIYLVMREAGAAEKQVILKKVYGMTDEELKKFWLGKLFREEIGAFPQTVGSVEGMKRFVSQAPNAIGFIDASALDDSVKPLRIEGKLPGQSGYPLTDSGD